MDKLLFKKILISAISLIAIIYVAYLLISANFNMMPTENAIDTTVTDKIFTNAFVVRDETVIKNDTNGILSYALKDGDAVNKDGEIAKIYSSEKDVSSQLKADSIVSKIENLKQIQTSAVQKGVGIDTINSNVNNKILSSIEYVNNCDINSISKSIDDVVYSINQRQIFTGKVKNFNDEITDLQSQLEDIKKSSKSSIGEIKASKAGYFSSYCDGYENSFDFKNIDLLTASQLDKIKGQKVASNNAGKIISDLDWYIVCKVSSDEATSLSLWDDTVTVFFSNATSDSVPASIYKINQKSNEKEALIILKCNYMNYELAQARQEPIEIGMGTYSGIRVSKKAIHDDYVKKTTYDDNGKKTVTKKKVQGVYVLYGNEVQFKEISIDYSGKDFVICNPSNDNDKLFSNNTISLYDQVILKGDGIYDGKVIK